MNYVLLGTNIQIQLNNKKFLMILPQAKDMTTYRLKISLEIESISIKLFLQAV